MNSSLTNKAAAPINSRQKKKTNQYSHSSCTWYINEYNFTHKAAAPITSRQKRKHTNIHTVAAHGILQLQLDTQGSSSHHLMAEKKTNKVAHGILQ